MDRRHLRGRAERRVPLEAPHGGAGRLGRAEPMSQPVRHHQAIAVRRVRRRPAIPADLLAGLGHAHRADFPAPGCRGRGLGRRDVGDDRRAARAARMRRRRRTRGAAPRRGRFPALPLVEWPSRKLSSTLAMPPPLSSARISSASRPGSARTISSPPPACLTRFVPSSLTRSASFSRGTSPSPTRAASSTTRRRASPT